MTPRIILALGAAALAIGSPAAAQTPATDAISQDRVERLEEQVRALQKQIEELKTQVAKPVPSWRGAPQFADSSEGWSFKPRGRLHFDTAYIEAPGAYAVNRNLGFNSRFRRARIGVEGSIPGGFGYVVELDFANGSVGFGNALLSYTPPSKAWSARLGNFETLNGLEQISSSNTITFLERAQFNDAFINTRRLGAAVALLGPDDRYRVEAGIFAAHSIDASFDNDGWIAAARAVYAPQLGNGRLHLGVSLQHREFQSNDNSVTSQSTGAPSTNQLARYRARPFLQTTDVRFVDTGNFAAKGDDILGVELAGIFGRLHLASEAQWTRTRSYRPGDFADGRDSFFDDVAITPFRNPRFFGIYGEAGLFLTGETRGYRDGAWSRTRVLNPISKGGSGAWQVAARVDYLDLDSSALKNAPTNNFSTGIAAPLSGTSRFGRGGTQTGVLFALNWHPVDYVRLMLNYIHVEVEGGPLAAVVKPLSTAPLDQRSYSTDAVAFRAQVEF
jgi:phosphate-selective porin OprO and OprP